MHPVVFTLPFVNFPVHSYGLMLALSFIVGIFLATWLAKRDKLDPNVISDAGFWIIISAIVGARLYYVFLHFDEFRGNLTSIFWPASQGEACGIGGLVMYGGVIGALIVGLGYLKLKKLPVLRYADVMAPAIGFGLFFTRIGCYLNGCCYGAPTTANIGVSFPLSSPAGHYQHAMHADALYPSQLFDSFGGLLIGVIVLAVAMRRHFPGAVLYLTGILYAIQRFFVDFSRYYSPDEKLGPLSHNQYVCIALFIIFGGLMLQNFLFRSESAQKSGATETEPVQEKSADPKPSVSAPDAQ